MGKYYALYNPKSCNNTGEERAKRLTNINLEMPVEFIDMTKIDELSSYAASLASEDAIILCGGDGTINYFINHTSEEDYNKDIFYFACGTGNDFFRDVSTSEKEYIVKINDYIKNLPIVTVNGKEYKFLNNVGFGIDGYCCQVGDELRAKKKDNINYTAIAIKGLLGGFKPVTATVTVDGKTEKFSKAWLAPTMNGRYYGGGMYATPNQDRLRKDGKVSVMLFYGYGKLKTLAVFPSIFQGEHVKHKEMVKIMEGNDIKVLFNRPCALQIDGETFLDVSEYSVHSDKR